MNTGISLFYFTISAFFDVISERLARTIGSIQSVRYFHLLISTSYLKQKIYDWIFMLTFSRYVKLGNKEFILITTNLCTAKHILGYYTTTTVCQCFLLVLNQMSLTLRWESDGEIWQIFGIQRVVFCTILFNKYLNVLHVNFYTYNAFLWGIFIK